MKKKNKYDQILVSLCLGGGKAKKAASMILTAKLETFNLESLGSLSNIRVALYSGAYSFLLRFSCGRGAFADVDDYARWAFVHSRFSLLGGLVFFIIQPG